MNSLNYNNFDSFDVKNVLINYRNFDEKMKIDASNTLFKVLDKHARKSGLIYTGEGILSHFPLLASVVPRSRPNDTLICKELKEYFGHQFPDIIWECEVGRVDKINQQTPKKPLSFITWDLDMDHQIMVYEVKNRNRVPEGPLPHPIIPEKDYESEVPRPPSSVAQSLPSVDHPTSSNQKRNSDHQNILPKKRLHLENQYCWPIIYSDAYNISFMGYDHLHPFDSKKWGHVFQYLQKAGMLSYENIISSYEVTPNELRVNHTDQYLDRLCHPSEVAKILEMHQIAEMPLAAIEDNILRPMRFQTGGTIKAARMAVDKKLSVINIGGGFHHASADRGGGFCVYADISVAIKSLLTERRIKNAMIIDLDAHQGNGHEHDFANTSDVYIFDMFNEGIYPCDTKAKGSINRMVPLKHYIKDDKYIEKLKDNLKKALDEFRPDLILYNAGTDCLINDPLGKLSITPKGIIKRDQIVFETAKMHGIPLVMVTSGGYHKESARVIADSILNLCDKKLI